MQGALFRLWVAMFMASPTVGSNLSRQVEFLRRCRVGHAEHSGYSLRDDTKIGISIPCHTWSHARLAARWSGSGRNNVLNDGTR